MYKDNYLTIDDEMELEDAGLYVEELADMDWDGRYDAIDEAGLDPMEYDYGFPDDEYSEDRVASNAKEEPRGSKSADYSNVRQMRKNKMSRRELRTQKKTEGKR